MKQCKSCGEAKEDRLFSPQSNAPDGLKYSCKSCSSKKARAWSLAHKERSNATCLAYQKRSPEKRAAWLAKNPGYMGEYMREWRKRRQCANIDYSKHGARRALPGWANRFFIKEAYRLARLRTKATGVRWEVDHIIPLNHPLASGLHVENNIRVIPMTINRSRGNRVSLQEVA